MSDILSRFKRLDSRASFCPFFANMLLFVCLSDTVTSSIIDMSMHSFPHSCFLIKSDHSVNYWCFIKVKLFAKAPQIHQMLPFLSIWIFSWAQGDLNPSSKLPFPKMNYFFTFLTYLIYSFYLCLMMCNTHLISWVVGNEELGGISQAALLLSPFKDSASTDDMW